jgi:hypothetical protein
MELVVAGGAILLFLLLIWFLAKTGMETSRLKKLPPTKVRDCREGAFVKIVGKVVPIDVLASPATARNCVGYTLTASSGKRSVFETRVVPFVIDDGTGEAIVDVADNAIGLDIEIDHKASSLLRTYKAEEFPQIEKLGLSSADSITEGVLEVGERVAVFGEVQLLSAPGGKSKVKVVRPAKQPYRVTDKEPFLG